MESHSTTYCKKKKAMGELPLGFEPFTFYHLEVINKCYIDKADILKNHAYAIKMKFNDKEGVMAMVMEIPSMVYHMQVKDEFQRIFFLTGLQKFFQLKPIQFDA